MKSIDFRWRAVAYIILMAAGAVMVTLGVITQELLDGIAPVAAGVLMVAGGGLATANLSPRDQSPTVTEWAELAHSSLPAILDEITRLRAAMEAHPEVGEVETGGYVGRHRLDP